MPKKIDRKIMNVDNSYLDILDSKFGVYGYFRNNGECIYVGIDSNINTHARHIHHLSPSKIREQDINSYVQSNAINGLCYKVLYLCKSKIEMENLETMFILFYKALGQCEFNKVVALTPELSTKLINGIAEIGRN